MESRKLKLLGFKKTKASAVLKEEKMLFFVFSNNFVRVLKRILNLASFETRCHSQMFFLDFVLYRKKTFFFSPQNVEDKEKLKKMAPQGFMDQFFLSKEPFSGNYGE